LDKVYATGIVCLLVGLGPLFPAFPQTLHVKLAFVCGADRPFTRDPHITPTFANHVGIPATSGGAFGAETREANP
jgi:hypothetical protein